MYIMVRYKREIQNADVIECGDFHQSGDRLVLYKNSFEETTRGLNYPFMSIALDQIAIWAVVDSPEAVKVPKPDCVIRVPLPDHDGMRAELERGGYVIGDVELGCYYVDLPVYYRGGV